MNFRAWFDLSLKCYQESLLNKTWYDKDKWRWFNETRRHHSGRESGKDKKNLYGVSTSKAFYYRTAWTAWVRRIRWTFTLHHVFCLCISTISRETDRHTCNTFFSIYFPSLFPINVSQCILFYFLFQILSNSASSCFHPLAFLQLQ